MNTSAPEIRFSQILPTVLASFGVMLCLGGVYAWSLFVPGLIYDYGFSAAQSQLVFGVVIAVFPATMLFVGQLPSRLSPRLLIAIAAVLFCSGYLLAGFSKGSFVLVLTGIGVLAGIGTGFGYLTSLTTPVRLYPARKGLLTGIAAGGFGLAAVATSMIVEQLFSRGWDVLAVFLWIGIVYGLIILTLGLLFRNPPQTSLPLPAIKLKELLRERAFLRKTSGIFLGTFAGLLMIGNLKPIGVNRSIDDHTLVLGVSVFAFANFAGRMGWGWLSDSLGAQRTIAIALMIQAVGIACFLPSSGGSTLFLIFVAITGFGFGANFVLFARETSQNYGVDRLGRIYPFVLLGYALAGIFGPVTGGLTFDLTSSYLPAIAIAAVASAVGSLLYIDSFRRRTEKIAG